MTRLFRCGGLLGCAALLALARPILSQEKPAREVIKIVTPVADKAGGRVTIAGAFWNEKLADWVEVGVCGRPSDFLHETVLCIPTTRALLEGALREAGFHDADAWVTSVRDFPRIRGDKMLVLAEFTRDGKKESFSLDELIGFQGWGVSAGPYGFLFKGDPGRGPATGPAENPPGMEDATKILRDDPQISLAFKGLQNMSQSFADHPLAYDDWVYPMMNFGRNYGVLPEKIYDSNGTVPVTVIFRKVTEEEFLRESAALWHEAGGRENILKQLPTAQRIDRDKAAYWTLFQQSRAAGPATAPDAAGSEAAGRLNLLAAQIESGYASLDAAWGVWAADHSSATLGHPEAAGGRGGADFSDPRIVEALKQETARWREHLLLEETSARQRAVAQEAQVEQQGLMRGAQSAETRRKLEQLRGAEIEARSKAMLANNQQSGERWKAELARIDPKNDPRVDWIKEITLRVEISDNQNEMAMLGVDYGKALQGGTGDLAALEKNYARAALRVKSGELRLELANIEFEISKREGFDNDRELPGLREKKKVMEAQLQELQAATRPATMPQ